MPLTPEQRAKKDAEFMAMAKWFLPLIAAIFVVGVIVVLVGGGGSDDSQTPPDVPAAVEPGQVEQVCHNQVLDQLKAPSTADFGGDQVTGFEPRWHDSGYVDAENSFGAKIRTNWTCIAIHTGGDNFQVKATLE